MRKRRRAPPTAPQAAEAPPKTAMAAALEATAVAALRHPVETKRLFDGIVDLAFRSRLRTLAGRPDSVGAAAQDLLVQLEVPR